LRKDIDFGMPADDGVVGREIDAERFSVGDIALDPLDVGPKLTQNIVHFRRGRVELLSVQRSDTRDISLDDEFA
jgi:hypothetical protein